MEKIIEKYCVKVDKICPKCEYRNVLNWMVDTKMNVIACGSCGEILLVPDDIDPEEMKVIKQALKQTLREVK